MCSIKINYYSAYMSKVLYSTVWMFVSLQNVYIEILMSKVMVLQCGADGIV